MIHIIYHSKDNDGHACAWLLKKYFDPKCHWPKAETNWPIGGETKFHPWDYGDPLPQFAPGDRFIFADITPTKEQLDSIRPDPVLILDHHKTAYEWLANEQGIDYIYNPEKSGCLLVWEHFFQGTPPELIRYINDADLWTWTLPNSKEINLNISSYDRKCWDELSRRTLYTGSFIEEGYAILRYSLALIDNIIATKHKVILMKGDYETVPMTAVQCSAGQLISQVGNMLAPACVYRKNGPKWEFSFRGEDVDRIAKNLGGGGHPKASGVNCVNPEFLGGDPLRIRLC